MTFDACAEIVFTQRLGVLPTPYGKSKAIAGT